MVTVIRVIRASKLLRISISTNRIFRSYQAWISLPADARMTSQPVYCRDRTGRLTAWARWQSIITDSLYNTSNWRSLYAHNYAHNAIFIYLFYKDCHVRNAPMKTSVAVNLNFTFFQCAYGLCAACRASSLDPIILINRRTLLINYSNPNNPVVVSLTIDAVIIDNCNKLILTQAVDFIDQCSDMRSVLQVLCRLNHTHLSVTITFMRTLSVTRAWALSVTRNMWDVARFVSPSLRIVLLLSPSQRFFCLYHRASALFCMWSQRIMWLLSALVMVARATIFSDLLSLFELSEIGLLELL